MNNFLISGSINHKRVREFEEFLNGADAGQPIVIAINSPGGDEGCGRALAGMIMHLRNSKVTVHTLGFGDIQSAAVIVFAAGENRKLSKLASVMVHESESTVEGNSSKIKKTAKQMEVDEQFWCGHLAAMTGTDAKTWMKLHEAETYLSPEEALKLNLATELI